MSLFLQAGSREDLEREIRRAVTQQGYCYTRDQLLTDQLAPTTAEQVEVWKQSYCAREGLTSRPYQEKADPGGYHLGTIFEALGHPVPVGDAD